MPRFARPPVPSTSADAAAPVAPSRRPSRRGSVLVFVVALVVLLAVVGTAFLSTARVDRYSSAQHGQNVATDLLMDGVTAAVEVALTDDLFGTDGQFRPAGQTPAPAEHFEGFDALRLNPATLDGDAFLAPRVPVKFIPTRGVTALYPTGGPGTPQPNPPVWRTISAPLFGGAFESPIRPAGYPYDLTYTAGEARDVVPTFVADAAGVRYPGFALKRSGATTQFQIDLMPKPPAAPILVQNRILAAADADNDGMADSGYVRLPGGKIDGLDWYIGIRVVDLGSAVNVNTAGDRRFDYLWDGSATTTGRLPLQSDFPTGNALNAGGGAVYNPTFFAAGVGLAQLLRTYDPTTANNLANVGDEFLRVNDRRFNFAAVSVGPYGNKIAGLLGNTGADYAKPIADTDDGTAPTSRPDFRFLTLGDALQHNLARRPANPGLNGETTGSATTFENAKKPFSYQAYGMLDAAALAYHGGANVNAASGASPLENDLREAIFERPTAPANNYPDFETKPYSLQPAGFTNQPEFVWFANLFAYDLENPTTPNQPNNVTSAYTGADPYGPYDLITFRSRRPLLTAFSPVAALSPVGQASPGVPGTGAFVPATILARDDDPAFTVSRVAFPADGVVSKTSINTAGDDDRTLTPAAAATAATYARNLSFAKLWRTFWRVMAEPDPVSPLTDFVTPMAAETGVYSGPAVDPSLGNEFIPQNQTPVVVGEDAFVAGVTGSIGTDAPQNPDRQFRSPIRDPLATPVLLTPKQTLLLRAGLAAVNLIDLRDGDDDVTVQKIGLGTGGGGIRAASIYGQERQPYLTEFYANTDNAYFPNAPQPVPTSGPAPTVTAPAAPAGANPEGYIALEFYNPYDVPIDLRNCVFATIDRRPGSATSPLTMSNTATDPTAPIDLSSATAVTSNLLSPGRYGGRPIVPARGTLVMENYSATGTPPNAALYRPDGAGFKRDVFAARTGPIDDDETTYGGTGAPPVAGNPSRVNVVFVQNLHTLLNREFVLLRPRSAVVDSTVTDIGGLGPAARLIYRQPPAPDVASAFFDFAPLDSFDATGIAPVTLAPPQPNATSWHYARETTRPWRFVYPGRYDAAQATAINVTLPDATMRPAGLTPPRQQGTRSTGYWLPTNTTPGDPADPGVDPNAPVPTYVAGSLPVAPSFAKATGDATYPTQFVIPVRDAGSAANAGSPGGLSPIINPGAPGVSAPVISGQRPDVDPNRFPFGGLPRNGDLLQVMFAGSYMLRTGDQTTVASAAVLEVNAMPIDTAFVDDTDPTTDTLDGDGTGVVDPATPLIDEDVNHNGLLDVNEDANGNGVLDPGEDVNGNGVLDAAEDANGNGFLDSYENALRVAEADKDLVRLENVGRFTPLFSRRHNDLVPNRGVVANGSYDAGVVGAAVGNAYRYRWATDLFDYFDVQVPGDDFLPNAGPKRYDRESDLPPNPDEPQPNPVANVPTAANGGTDALAGVQGRINLNTAPETVLATIPWLPEGDEMGFDQTTGAVTFGPNLVSDNVDLARAIVYWRDGNPADPNAPANGPFRSIFDLYRVPAVLVAQGTLYSTPGTVRNRADPGDLEGDPTPPDVGAAVLDDGVDYDYEEQFLLMTRVSNYVTVQSDAFAVYVLLQGWENAGTTTARPVVTQRRAFLFDRSAVTPGERRGRVVPIATD